MSYEAVVFDLGGVVFPSPLVAFDVYDVEAGFEPGTVRRIVRDSAESGAWAALERGELSLDACYAALAAEARDAGVEVDVARVFELIGSASRPYPAMVRAVDRIREEGLRVGALTNNWIGADGAHAPGGDERGITFDVVVESAVEGIRKPDPAIYELVLDRLGVAAEHTVYLDDLGPNLKPARAMGMTTIKVVDPDVALGELRDVVGFELV
jgi:putative hydrolase of the HAD superfamily